jgi:hypothetical protein
MDGRVRGDPIPKGDSVARHCRFTDYFEENGEVRVTGDAFKYDPGGVSVTWVEYFSGSPKEQIFAVTKIIRSTRDVKQSHRLALIGVGTILECGHMHGLNLTVEHDPIADPRPNLAHCLIKGIAADATTLRELLALKARAVMFP